MSAAGSFPKLGLFTAVVVAMLVGAAGFIVPVSAVAPVAQWQARCQPPVPASLVGVDLERIPTNDKVVALTFDAGANADGVPKILQTLDSENVPGTFFLTGQFAQNFPDPARRISENHPLGNHSFSHPDLTTLSDEQVVAEVHNAEEAIQEITGKNPRPFFRFPYGAREARTIGIVNELCYAAFRWTVDTLGWKGTSGGMTADKVTQRVVSAATAGEIVLMHVGSHPTDGSTLDADALPDVINELQAQGYGFMSLEQLVDR